MKMLPPLRGLVQLHVPSGVVGEADTGAAGEIVEHLTELVQQPTAAAPLSAVITVEDVGSTMVVAVVFGSSRFALL
jgi:hypothetical protein